MWRKRNKRKVIFPALVIAALAAAFCFGGCSGNASPSPAPEASAPQTLAPAPSPENTPAGNTVTMSISCAVILDNLDLLDPDKTELVPEDGWILEPVTVELQEGDTVFDLLLRVTREHKIHMEYAQAPMYGSAYIEGIANLYEFDCGAGSGWMYAVNGWYPNYGCSGYKLEPGDGVEWRDTCDTGEDIGGGYQGQE